MIVMNYLKLNENNASCALHVNNHLQCEKCVSAIPIISSADKYSWVRHVFKDLHKEADRLLLECIERTVDCASPNIWYWCYFSFLKHRTYFDLSLFLSVTDSTFLQEWCYLSASLHNGKIPPIFKSQLLFVA